ncbi:RecX family transcriptional regulator [Sphingomonas sp.]|uniref:RecX family transcriptional regulator n=1 Tax=Sphingomonas sp. TaxID=28214 RepID=UPI0025E5D670|nr:RecX family transcriptional regulator [Sphingomonas sp.]
MRPSPRNVTRSPLDAAALNRFALAYVGRYATTQAKLATYLQRKLRERGWEGEGDPPLDAVVARIVEAGYVDDAAFAAARSGTLTRRGFGSRRIGQALSAEGIDRELAASFDHDADAAFTAAETFARRRRIGPYAIAAADDAARRKALSAMVRGGHGFALARRFVDSAPGEVPDREDR